jgi:hypothetical protein
MCILMINYIGLYGEPCIEISHAIFRDGYFYSLSQGYGPKHVPFL